MNAWVARNALPVQYGALEVTKFRPWTALDSAIIGKALAFSLSFDIDTGPTTDYQTYVAKLGPQLAMRCSSATSSAPRRSTRRRACRMRPASRRSSAP